MLQAIGNTECVATEATPNVYITREMWCTNSGSDGDSDGDDNTSGALDMSFTLLLVAGFSIECWFRIFNFFQIVSMCFCHFSTKCWCKDDGMCHCVFFDVKVVFS